MKLLSGLLAALAMLAISGISTAEEPDFGKLIVGKWKITKTESDAPVGTLVEFTKDGKLIIVIKEGDKDLKLDGTYKIEKDKLVHEINIEGNPVKNTDTIKKLTEDTMELVDDDKKVTVMKKEK